MGGAPRTPPVHPLCRRKGGLADCVVDRGAALLNPRLTPEASSGRVATEVWLRRCAGFGGGSVCEGGMPPAEVFGAKMKAPGQGGRGACPVVTGGAGKSPIRSIFVKLSRQPEHVTRAGSIQMSRVSVFVDGETISDHVAAE